MPEKSICFVYNTSQYLFLHRFDLMETMVKNGFMIYAIAPRDEYSEKIKGTNIHFIEINIDRKGYNPLNDLLFFYRLLKIYLRIRPQIVHHFTIKPIVYGSICARVLNIPKIVNSINGLGYLLLNKGMKTVFAKYIYKVSIDKDNIINIFQNKDDMKTFITALRKILTDAGITNLPSPFNDGDNKYDNIYNAISLLGLITSGATALMCMISAVLVFINRGS